MSAAPAEVKLPESDEDQAADRPWIVIVWNDPINLMSYVVLVFQKLFGYNRAKATELMLTCTTKGARWSPPAPARRPSWTCSGCTSTASGPR